MISPTEVTLGRIATAASKAGKGTGRMQQYIAPQFEDKPLAPGIAKKKSNDDEL